MARGVVLGVDPDADAPVFGGLSRAELIELVVLTSRDPRTLSDDELAQVGALARAGLYRHDDGNLPEYCGFGICACDGKCVNERPGLTPERSEWLNGCYAACLKEQGQRMADRYVQYHRPVDSPKQLRNAVPPPTAAARARPREHRARPTRRVLVRSGSRGDPPPDDPEPEPPLVRGPGITQGRLGVDEPV